MVNHHARFNAGAKRRLWITRVIFFFATAARGSNRDVKLGP